MFRVIKGEDKFQQCEIKNDTIANEEKEIKLDFMRIIREITILATESSWGYPVNRIARNTIKANIEKITDSICLIKYILDKGVQEQPESVIDNIEGQIQSIRFLDIIPYIDMIFKGYNEVKYDMSCEQTNELELDLTRIENTLSNMKKAIEIELKKRNKAILEY